MLSILKQITTEKKLNILTESAKYDVCMSSCNQNSNGTGTGRTADPYNPFNKWIYPVNIPGKGIVNILKILQTNICHNNCKYCILSSKNDKVKRTFFKPEELAKIFITLVKSYNLHGIFISSGTGICSEKSMADIIETAKILRENYKFPHYIHLKLLPGVSENLIDNAIRYANRISINLEAPKKEILKKIAPDKDMINDLILPMKLAGNIIKKKGNFAKSQTTQFVVGASDETDIDILKSVDWIYRELFVFRAYFSSLQLLESTNSSLLREHRLYQADYLLRGYGFRLKDIIFDENGNIPAECDPKTAYALMHPEIFPIDINKAPENLLLKVPGIGPVAAKRIIEKRKTEKFNTLQELSGTGAVIKRAHQYIELSGKSVKTHFTQKELFDDYDINTKKWKTGIIPYQQNKIKTDSSGIQKDTYEYPGQKDKPLFKSYNKNYEIFCR